MNILTFIPHRHLAIAGILGLIVGLVTSQALISISMMVLAGNGILHNNVLQNFRNWLKEPASVLLLLFFLAYVVSGFYSDDLGYWMDRCRIKIPFIAMPFGFAVLNPFSKKLYQSILAFYVVVIFIAATWMMIHYVWDYQHYNVMIKQGQPIPAPLNEHIRFSLEMAFAIICGAYLIFNLQITSGRIFKWILGMITIFLFVALHVFAVRSGIAALYIAAFSVVLIYFLQKKKILVGIVTLVTLTLFAIAAIHWIPSLANKYGYFKYELEMIKNKEIRAEHSDAQRLVSMQLGLHAIQKNWLLGVGAGDIKTTMQQQYDTYYPDKGFAVKTPHNQFIYVWVCTGIFGFIIFLLAFFYPLTITSLRQNLLFVGFFITVFLSIMTEHTFEIQLGTAFYILFLMLFLHSRKSSTYSHA